MLRAGSGGNKKIKLHVISDEKFLFNKKVYFCNLI